MAVAGPSRSHSTPLDELEPPKSATYAVPIDITDRDAEGEEDYALQAEEVAKDSPAPLEVDAPIAADSPSALPVKAAPGRPGKRKLADLHAAGPAPPPPVDSATISAAPSLIPAPFMPPVPGFYLTRGHPMNKQNYRYVPCGPAPGSSLLYPLYRVIPSPPANCVRFAWEDRSQYIAISKDGMAVTADKGFRSARGNVPIREGTWYFEVLIEKGGGEPGHWAGGGAHVRVGVGRRESPLTAPVGFDGHSYGIRDKTGEAVTLSVPKAYGPSFASGDVVGVLLTLPPRRAGDAEDQSDPAHLRRMRIPIRYKGQLYFESLDYPATREMAEVLEAVANRGEKKPAPKVKAAAPGTRRAPQFVPPPSRPLSKLEGSRLEFFKNGEPLGTAFEDLYDYLPLRAHARPRNAKPIAPGSDAARENHHDDGTLGYYPLVSCFGGGTARLLPGPVFRFPPSDLAIPWRPLSERYDEYMDETRALDEVDEATLRAAIDYEANERAKREKKVKLAVPVVELSASPASMHVATPPASVELEVGAMETDELPLVNGHMDVDEAIV